MQEDIFFHKRLTVTTVNEKCRLGLPFLIDTQFCMTHRVKNKTNLTSREPGSSVRKTAVLQ